jgi:diguanylate cyclase (GGDEF)-like protein
VLVLKQVISSNHFDLISKLILHLFDNLRLADFMTDYTTTLKRIFSLRRIGVRLTLSYGLLLLIFACTVLIAVVAIQKMTKLSKQFTDEDMNRLLIVQQISLSIEASSSALLRLLTAEKEMRISEYTVVDERNQMVSENILALTKVIKGSQQEQTLKRLIQSRSKYQEAFIITVDLLELEGQDVAQKSYITMIQPAFDELIKESKMLVNRERDQIQAKQLQAQNELERTGLLIAILSFIAVAMAAMLAWLTTRSVVRPLARLELSALQIASGDYKTKVPTTKTEEINRVGQALNEMTSAIGTRENEIEKLAYYDLRTGLPNRTHLLKIYGEQTVAHHGMILMDVARLKIVNATLGFDTGDKVISEAAERIKHVLDHSQELNKLFLARLSGGSFALFCEENNFARIEEIKSQIEHAMLQPVLHSSHAIDVSLVFGIATSSEKANSVISLLRNAEVALYSAKREGIKTAWYSDAKEASRLSHLSLLSDLRSAVKASDLQMWLQPKIKLSTMQGYGFEALVRWQHPQRGFISPAEFVPFAESTGYIGVITEWMLHQALSKIVSWKDTHGHQTIAVNVSTFDLRDPNFPNRVKNLIEEYSVDPQLLKIEITESGIMEDPASAINVLHQLRDIGIQLSIDDFGTGHSSMAYLQKLPVNELKIDRSFIINIDQQPTTQRLVKAMIEMGHGLNLSVIAEGIETQAERDTLFNLGCEAMQGYFASKPLHGAQLQAWLDKL